MHRLDQPPPWSVAASSSPRPRSDARVRQRHVRGVAGTRDHHDAEAERVRVLERARLAVEIDGELGRACHAEAAARLVVGGVAGELLRRRAYRRLGFVRVSDYACERLGISARALEVAAQVAARLDELPLIAAAFRSGELSWTHVRLLCGVARREDEAEWLARAHSGTVAALEARIATERDARGHASASDPEDDLIDGEPPVQLRIACPGRVRWLWRYALELARRVAGEQLPTWRAAELIAAEGIASRPIGSRVGDRVLLAFMRLKRRLSRSAATPQHGPGAPAATVAAPSAGLPGPAVAPEARRADAAAPPTTIPPDLAGCDAFTLDARLTDAMHAIRRAEPRIGRLLRMIVDHRLYRALGFTSADAYVRERLGISLRKAWALLKIERAVRRDALFARAYESGTLSWVRALTLLPVVDRRTSAEWITRANAATVRRLSDEVSWVLDVRDVFGYDVPLVPPPPGSALVPPARIAPAHGPDGDAQCRKTSPSQIVQIGALSVPQRQWTQNGTGVAAEVCDGEIRFTGPASVIALFRDALDTFARAGEPRWAAVERVLTTVIAGWEAEPGHRDPVFARDGWRCAVPACSSRRNLHDHHIQFRSRGGANDRANRVSVCAAHHLPGIHTGVIGAWGPAPAAVHWQLGLRSDAPPLLTYIGDRLELAAFAGTSVAIDDLLPGR